MINLYIVADNPLYDNKVPHLRCEKKDICDVVLLPGDPGRVEFFSELLDDFQIISSNREYKLAKGTYKGYPVNICSTGIGAASTEIAVTELIELGAKALIRIGGTGAIKDGVECGDFIINTASVRLGGSSMFYAMPEYPAVADFNLVMCLKEACKEKNLKHHLGIGASVGSFYRGQGRNPLSMEKDKKYKDLYEEFIRLNVLNMEMEAETIFTLSSIYGVMAGSICTVHCNRLTNKWLVEYEEPQKTMCKTALEAVTKVYENCLK
ncbi:MAG: nucleoside phosphorylase [Clostridiaceae bacterium]